MGNWLNFYQKLNGLVPQQLRGESDVRGLLYPMQCPVSTSPHGRLWLERHGVEALLVTAQSWPLGITHILVSLFLILKVTDREGVAVIVGMMQGTLRNLGAPAGPKGILFPPRCSILLSGKSRKNNLCCLGITRITLLCYS